MQERLSIFDGKNEQTHLNPLLIYKNITILAQKLKSTR
jgi:hypothetical protein